MTFEKPKMDMEFVHLDILTHCCICGHWRACSSLNINIPTPCSLNVDEIWFVSLRGLCFVTFCLEKNRQLFHLYFRVQRSSIDDIGGTTKHAAHAAARLFPSSRSILS